MSCTASNCGVTTECGIGGWGGPKPGDPDNNVSISASTVTEGIQVNWTYPNTNPYAVAHIKLKRSLSSDVTKAIDLAIVSGSSYVDLLKPETPTEYFYWIQIVSVNGTEAALVGPAAATAYPRSTNLLNDLHQSIDESVLAQALRRRIEDITLNYNELTGKIAERIASDAALSTALQRVREGLDESIGLIHEEAIIRQEGQSALASQMLTIAAVNTNNAAAILAEQTARVAADEAFATSVQTIAAATQKNAALINNETIARTTADSALASQVNNVQVNMNNQFAAVRQDMTAQYNEITNEVDSIWTVRVDAGGRVGGVGLHGSPGKGIDFAVNADRFWIDHPNGQGKVKPFVVYNGVVYIDKARIREATIETLHLGANAATGGMGTRFGWPTATTVGSQFGSIAAVQVDMGSNSSTGCIQVNLSIGAFGNAGGARITGSSGFNVDFPINTGFWETDQGGNPVNKVIAITTLVFVDSNPRPGINTYLFQCRSPVNWQNLSVTGFMSAIGLKR